MTPASLEELVLVVHERQHTHIEMRDLAQLLGLLSRIVKPRNESEVLGYRELDSVALLGLIPEVDQLLRSCDVGRDGLLRENMLAGSEGCFDVLGLVADWKGDDDGGDVVASEEVFVGFTVAAVGGVEVDLG